ncbi:MAG TPA: chemotaxis protein CheB, partial [Verrucomicrobiae bacterium]|nr:chemotaxis protein CheB [Verrucomicrobiae bacterium]
MKPIRKAERKNHVGPLEKIVGIGASAGGLEAFTELLRNLPLDLNVAYILVQHLDPSHPSLLSELLSRTTQLPVQEIAHNTKIQGKQIYVIPANSDLTIVRGVLKLSPRQRSTRSARSIDNFLTSLAVDQKSKAVAVILSGAGSDGAQGLRAVKAAGGITFAQDERSARYDSMPRAAVATGCVDFVLPPEKIAAELIRLVVTPDSFQSRAAANEKRRRKQLPSAARFGTSLEVPFKWPAAPGDANLKRIFQLLRARTGLDFTFYKANTIRRRLARRMSLCKVNGLARYSKYLQQHPAELASLHQDLLINVTSFFRNPPVYDQLKRKVFPKLVKNLSGSDTLRIWVAGCSTGQEAYSIAMAYAEFADNAEVRVPIQIFASDVNGAILESARSGRYSKVEVSGVNRDRLRRFFTEEEGHFRVVKAVRDLVVFAQHNLLLDPPFTRVDLISCRNMLIYFDSALQQKIIPAFHYALKPNGILLLGASESVGQFHNLFGTVESRHRIYIKKPAANWPRFERPPTLPSTRKSLLPATVKSSEFSPGEAQKEADRVVLHKYAPPGILLNAEGEVLQFRGDVGKYLKLPSGKASFHISKIARDDLALPLERAFQKARRHRKLVREAGVCVTGRGALDLTVVPLKMKVPCFLVLFQEAATPQRTHGRKSAGKVAHGRRELNEVSRLKHEVAAAHEHIEALQEEHDTSVEELQASNEEVQSANEELQSLNEELETSNEELESANEELTTLNEELATRNSELRESEVRLREQATLLEMAPLLARSAKDRIILWSRGAEQMYGYTAEEAVGQNPHILLDIQTVAPLHEVQEKLLKTGHWEGEVTHRRKDGKVLHVAAQWVVHQDSQKKLRAILEVHTDITARKQAENALAQSERFNRTVLDCSPGCIKVLDLEGRVIFVNPAGRTLLEAGDSEVQAKAYWPGLWDGEGREHAEKAYRSGIAGKPSHFTAFRLTPKGTPRWWDVIVEPIVLADGKPEQLLVVMHDVTRHKNEQLAATERAHLSDLRAKIAYHIAVNAPLQPVLLTVADTLVRDLGLAAARFWTVEDSSQSVVMQAATGLPLVFQGGGREATGVSNLIQQIADTREPRVANDLRQGGMAAEWNGAVPETAASFAGYPLVVGERLVGVLEAYGKA